MNNRITQIFKQRYLSDLQTAFIVFWVLDLLEGIDSGFQSDMFFYAIIFTTVVSFLLLIIYATQKVRNDKLFYGKVTPWVEVTEPTGYIKTKKTLARWKVTYYLSLYAVMPAILFYLYYQGSPYEELLHGIVTTIFMIWLIAGFVLFFNGDEDA